jgi:2-keto-3-deoxy-L-rhamnonate aldolase RhmA
VSTTPHATFRERLKSGELLLGTFIKTPTSHATEILGGAGFDFVVVDEEHAPINRTDTDQIMLACRAAGIAGFVHVAEPSAAQILSALDCGATGVLVPHVSSAEKAKTIARAGRYRNGNRGFSNSSRTGGYGTVSMAAHVANGDATTTMVAMIEDPEAIDAVPAIVAVEGIDAIFVGRGDLTVAFGAAKATDDVVRNAVARIVAAARQAKVPVLMMVGSIAEAQDFVAMGVNGFIVASDQGFMRQAAQKTRADFNSLKS